jgi:hypothetical protein
VSGHLPRRFRQSGTGRSICERSAAGSVFDGINISVASLMSTQIQMQISALLLKKRFLEHSVCKDIKFFWYLKFFLYNFGINQLLFGIVSKTLKKVIMQIPLWQG